MRTSILVIAGALTMSTLGLTVVTPVADARFPIPFPGGDITGVVRQASTGLPVGEGVEVTLSRKGVVLETDVTDEFGGFDFAELRPGLYTLGARGSSRTISIGSFSAFIALHVK